MKNILVYLFLSVIICSFWSCKEDDLDSNSIFSTEEIKRNDFDVWLLNNYTYPYNVAFKYRLEDIESSYKYNLAPADLDKSIILAKLVKYLWVEAYNEVVNVEFTRTYIPKVIHLIGSSGYEDNGTEVLGTAEGGMKVTLYNVNNLTLDINFLNHYFFKTMHHEFAHILNQTKNYDPEFDRISESDYVSGDWYLNTNYLSQGFVSAYASSEPREDFVEVIAIFVTNTPEYWQALLSAAGSNSAAIINQKFEIINNYMIDSWGIDLYDLRDIVQRRVGDIGVLDFETL